MMDYFPNVTPVASPPSFYSSQASTGRPYSNVQQIGLTSLLSTTSEKKSSLKGANPQSTQIPPSGRAPADATPLLSNVHEHAARAATIAFSDQGNDTDIRKTTESRIRLLAEKYANDAISAEMMARLEILNSRLTKYAPRVSEEQIGALEASIGSLRSIEDSRIARAKRLGLKI